MTDDDYRALMATLEAAARTWAVMLSTVSDEELAHVRATIDHADALGPILHPSEWIQQSSREGLSRQRMLIKATRDFRAALRELFPGAADRAILSGALAGVGKVRVKPDPAGEPLMRRGLEDVGGLPSGHCEPGEHHAGGGS